MMAYPRARDPQKRTAERKKMGRKEVQPNKYNTKQAEHRVVRVQHNERFTKQMNGEGRDRSVR